MKYSKFLETAMKADAFKNLQKGFVDYIGLKDIILKLEAGGMTVSEQEALRAKFKESLSNDISRIDAITKHLLGKIREEMVVAGIPIDDIPELSPQKIGEAQ